MNKGIKPDYYVNLFKIKKKEEINKKMFERKQESDYICKSTLKERGWTDSIIKKLNVQPDKLADNPHYKKAPQMKLYLIEKIKQIEQTSEFKELIKKSEKRKKSAKTTVITRKNNLINYIKYLLIDIPEIDETELTHLAIEHYNQHKRDVSFEVYQYNPERSNKIDEQIIKLNDIKNLSLEFLNRIKVNYIRHELSDYDEYLDELYKQIGKEEAYILLKNRILDEISKVYPNLKNECEKQKN